MMLIELREAVAGIDVEADTPQFMRASLGARCYVVTPMSTFGAHRTT